MASTSAWFESVAEAQRRAKRRLPRSVYQALLAGAERGVTLADNVAAFDELGFVPRIATGLAAPRELATTVLGHELAMPVLISPTGVQAVDPAAEDHDNETRVARAGRTRCPREEACAA